MQQTSHLTQKVLYNRKEIDTYFMRKNITYKFSQEKYNFLSTLEVRKIKIWKKNCSWSVISYTRDGSILPPISLAFTTSINLHLHLFLVVVFSSSSSSSVVVFSTRSLRQSLCFIYYTASYTLSTRLTACMRRGLLNDWLKTRIFLWFKISRKRKELNSLCTQISQFKNCQL